MKMKGKNHRFLFEMILYASGIWKYTLFYYGFRELWVYVLVLIARFYNIHNRRIILQECVCYGATRLLYI